MGTLLRSGDQLRVMAQLVEAPGGTLLTSHTVQSSLGDLFRLQDDIARRVVEALALPLGGNASPTPDVQHDARAYELYLRANDLARTYDGLPAARDLYQRCLELEPSFAPAWAHLGRCHRVIGKYIDRRDRQLRAGGEALPPRPGAEPAPLPGPQVLRPPRSRHRPGHGRAGAAAARGRPPRQRSGAVRGAGPCLPLLRPLRAVDRRPRRGAPPRSEHSHQRRADDLDDGRHRAPAGGRRAPGRRRRRRGHPRHRPRAGRAARGGTPAPRRAEARGAHPDLPDLDGLPAWRGSSSGRPTWS